MIQYLLANPDVLTGVLGILGGIVAVLGTLLLAILKHKGLVTAADVDFAIDEITKARSLFGNILGMTGEVKEEAKEVVSKITDKTGLDSDQVKVIAKELQVKGTTNKKKIINAALAVLSMKLEKKGFGPAISIVKHF